MAPATENLHNVAEQAERDLNTHKAKTGAHRNAPSDEAGVDSGVENNVPGAEVRHDSDLSTDAGCSKRILPEEGGEADARGRARRRRPGGSAAAGDAAAGYGQGDGPAARQGSDIEGARGDPGDNMPEARQWPAEESGSGSQQLATSGRYETIC